MILEAPPPDLGRDGVWLRPWRRADASALVAGWIDDEVARWLPVPERRDLTAARRWISGWDRRRTLGLALDLVIVDDDDHCLGEVGLSHVDEARSAALIGWWLLPAARGSGAGATAVDLAAGWLLGAVGLAALLALIDQENEPSLALATRCGFEEIGRRDDHQLVFARRATGD